MASVTPRAGFWEEGMTSNYFGGDDDEVEQQALIDDVFVDGRSQLDRTIDRIGMGSYQWILVSLCGFGWMADNMWLQAVAIILPRVQRHYDVPDSYIGVVSSAMFAGMMIGAVCWGTCSDLMGRSTAFNATLFFTAVFGLLASISYSYTSLCILLFLLGTAVGGSMPTDGTLLLEYMPHGKQYLVTALSVFFSLGSVLTSVVALLIVPQHSCSATAEVCEDNDGWKYLLIALGFITLGMFLARMVFFRLHESPRFLVHAGRHQEAVDALQLISRFNGDPLNLDLDDVDDTRQSRSLPARIASAESPDHDYVDYSATGETFPQLDSHAFTSTEIEHSDPILSEEALPKEDDEISEPVPPTRPSLDRRRTSNASSTSSASKRRASSMYEKKICGALPRFIRRPLWEWWDRLMLVLTPEWRLTTILVWASWGTMALAYTMFNVFLPKLLETGSQKEVPKSLEASLWDVVIFTLGGCPGALLGAYLVESPLGKRWSLASSTFLTAFFCVIFILVEKEWAVRASTMAVSLSVTVMWAVLYGWTPGIFGTQVRGTACGTASALSRIGGMIAPILGGILLMIDRTVPVYTSVGVFIVAGVCVLCLKEDAGAAEDSADDDGTLVH